MTNVTLTAEQAQQIDNMFEFVLKYPKAATNGKAIQEVLNNFRAAREQEPVCKRCNGTKIVPDGKMYNVDGFQLEVPIECVKDYPDCTAPVRTKDLTDEEIEAAVLSVNTTMEAWITYRAVIAKFKEKNK